MVCCFGSGAQQEEPVVVDDFVRMEDLRNRISSITAPIEINWAADATINTSYLGAAGGAPIAAAPPAAAQRPSSVGHLGTFERRHTMRPDGRGESGSMTLQWTDSRKLLEAAIAMEQLEPMDAIPEHQPPPASRWGWGWEDDWSTTQAAEQRLQGRLFKLKLEHILMEGDGSCQFRAVSFGLYGTQQHHAFVRRRAVDYMRQNPSEFQAFLGEEWGGYLAQMSRDGTWGDELTLRAICEALSVVVNVISSDAQNWFLRYIPRSTRPRHECFLTYIAPVHYNAVRRQNTGDRLRRSFGRQGSALARAVSTYQRNYGIPETPRHVAAAGLVG